MFFFQKGDKDKDKGKRKDSGREEESEGMVTMPKDDNLEEIDQKDDGYIELVLRVLARMCDGQHKGLQVGYVVDNRYVYIRDSRRFPGERASNNSGII